MNTGIGDDPTKLSLFPVLDLSLESLGEDEQRLFLSLVVLARGVVAPAPMLANLWQKVRVLMWWVTEPSKTKRSRTCRYCGAGIESFEESKL